MLRNVLLGCVAVFAGSSFVAGAAQDDLKAAAQKLSDSNGYSWKTTVQAAGGGGGGGGGAGTVEGMTQKDGYTVIILSRGENKTEVVRKGDKVAVKTEEGWKTPEELGGGAGGGGGGGGRNPARAAARMAQTVQPPATTAMELANEAKDVSASDTGFAGQLSEDAAKKAIAPRGGRRGGGGGGNANAPQITNPKGDVKFTVKDGVLMGYELHVTGSAEVNGNTREIDRTTTVVISDVGSPKIDVPDEAKKKLGE